MSYLPKEGYKKILVIAAYIILGTAAAVITVKYLLEPCLPFLLAWLTAMLLRPSIRKISKRTGISEKAVSAVSIVFVLMLVIGAVTVLFGRLVSELKGIAENLMSDAAGAVGDVFDYLERISEKLPFTDGDGESSERIKNAVLSMVEGAVSSFSARIPAAVLDVAAALPDFLLFAIALIMSTFYMGADLGGINRFIVGLVPKSSRERLFEAKRKLTSAGVKYVRAYLLILFITFAQLLVGFLCLKIPYALTLASVIALIDILPILGVGTVLVPWAAVMFIRGDKFLGFGLLIIFGIIWLVRQVVEPKIVGSSMGISPLVTLIAMYSGYKLIGFSGLFVFPLVIILVKNLNDIGVFRLGQRE